MPRVYLDTSFISACVTTRQSARAIDHRNVSLEWLQTQAAVHQVFVSTEVLEELDQDEYPQRDLAMEFALRFPLLAVSDEALGLAQILVDHLVMPGPVAGDAVHVAVCCIERLEYLLSWNIRHLANPNKTAHLANVCRRAGVIPPRIITPEFLWEKPQ